MIHFLLKDFIQDCLHKVDTDGFIMYLLVFALEILRMMDYIVLGALFGWKKRRKIQIKEKSIRAIQKMAL